MKHQTINLVKFKALQKRLGLSLFETVGLLETLWIFAQIQARDGEIGKFSPLEIAGWIEYHGDDGKLIDALVETRWLERDGDRLSIHDWAEHRPNWLKGVDARRGEPGSAPSTEPGSVPGSEPSTVPSTEPPNLTQPRPNPRPRPNPDLNPKDKIDDVYDDEVLVFDSVAGMEAASRLARALEKRRMTRLDPNWIWECCCVAEALRPGLVADTASKIIERQIAKPKAYLEKTLRTECEERGLKLAQVRKRCPPRPAKQPA